jgi:hypothetical protein
MIHITEEPNGSDSVTIKAAGRMDADSAKTLEVVIERNLEAKQNVNLQLEGITHIDRDGTDFLRRHRNRIILEGLSEFVKLELGLADRNVNSRTQEKENAK